MTLNSPWIGIARRYLVPFLAVTFVAASVFVVGVLKHGGAKDIDTRYFYVAGKCWAAGKSPYEPAMFDAMFQATYGSHPDALFVAYLPTLMVLALPMAPFSRSTGAVIFSCMNFGAAMVLFWCCYRLVKESIGTDLSVQSWLWVVLAGTLGGTGGTIFTGQTSVFITAACALAILGCRLKQTWMIVLGMVIATAKPHISGPLLLFIPLFEPMARKATAIAAGIFAAIVAYAAAVDTNLIHSYLDSMRIYNALKVNDPLKQVGTISLLMRWGVSSSIAQKVGILGLLVVLGLTAWVLKRSGKVLSASPIAILLLVFSVGLAKSIQGYDLCCYALGIALVATLPRRHQWLLVIPTLIVWRPAIFELLHVDVDRTVVSTVAWLALLFGTAVFATLQLRQEKMPSPDRLAIQDQAV